MRFSAQAMGTLLAAALCSLCEPGMATDYLELNDFQLIDATGAAPRQVDRLIARDGLIVSIDTLGQVPTAEPDATWTRVGLAGAWVIPGLIDTHVHIGRFAEPRRRADIILRSALRGGVTAVRDLGGNARALGEVERAIEDGELPGPTLIYSALYGGPDIFKEGPMVQQAGNAVPGTLPWSRSIDVNSDLRQVVAEGKGTGARNVKIYGDLSAKLATEVIAEARRQGLLTTAHATVFPGRPSDLVEAGVGSLAHAAYLVWEAADSVPSDYRARISAPWTTIAPDHPKLLALYRQMAAKGVSLDATLYVYEALNAYPGMPPQAWTTQAAAWGAQATRLAREAGVHVTTGTDWFEPAEETGQPRTHAELALLVEKAGFTPMQAIISGTRHGAEALGLLRTHGTVELGKFADLVVLNADPLADIQNTTQIRMTVRHGVITKPE